jgi:hypothetical protein
MMALQSAILVRLNDDNVFGGDVLIKSPDRRRVHRVSHFYWVKAVAALTV